MKRQACTAMVGDNMKTAQEALLLKSLLDLPAGHVNSCFNEVATTRLPPISFTTKPLTVEESVLQYFIKTLGLGNGSSSTVIKQSVCQEATARYESIVKRGDVATKERQDRRRHMLLEIERTRASAAKLPPKKRKPSLRGKRSSAAELRHLHQSMIRSAVSHRKVVACYSAASSRSVVVSRQYQRQYQMTRRSGNSREKMLQLFRDAAACAR